MVKRGLLIFASQTGASYSGSGKSAMRLARAMATRGHKVAVLTYGSKINFTDSASESSVRIIRIPRWQSLFWQKIFVRLISPLYIAAYSFRYRNVLIFGAFQGYLMAILAAKVLGAHVVFRSTLMGSDNPLAICKKGPSRQLLLGWIDAYLPISLQFTDDFLMAFPKAKHKVINAQAGVDITAYSPIGNDEKKRRREQMGFSENDFIIVSVGNLVERKGYTAIFETLAQVNGNFKYIILGAKSVTPHNLWHSQNEMDAIVEHGIKLLSNRVFFEGWVENVEEYLSISDAYLLNSSAEGMPNSLLEAMACGVAPIVQRGLQLEGFLLKDGVNAICFTLPHELKEAVENLIADELNRQRIAIEARHTIEMGYGLDSIVRALSDSLR